MDRERNQGLDLMRATAIVLVLVCHWIILLPQFPGKTATFWITGVLGVELFFVLSGYLVGSILIDLFLHNDAVAFADLLWFWKRRWLRTLPNYFFFFLIFLFLFPPHFRITGFQHLLFFQNLAWRPPPFYEISWSLAVEEWFYLTLPIWLFLFSRIAKTHRIAALSLAIATYIAVFTLARLYFAGHFTADWDQDVRKVVVFRLDTIGYGVIVALASACAPALLDRSKLILLFAGSAMLTATQWWLYSAISVARFGYFEKTWLFSLMSLSVALLIPWLVSVRLGSGLIARVVYKVSVWSYSMYLVHWIAVKLLAPAHIGALGKSLIYWFCTVVLSIVAYRFIEGPFLRLRHPQRPGRPAA